MMMVMMMIVMIMTPQGLAAWTGQTRLLATRAGIVQYRVQSTDYRTALQT